MISATFLAMPLQVSNAFIRSKLLVIGSSDFSSKTRQEHKAMMLLASMSAKTFWNTILKKIQTESVARPDLQVTTNDDHEIPWLWNLWLRSMPHLDLHLHTFAHCVISAYFCYARLQQAQHDTCVMPVPRCAKSLSHEDLIRWSDLAGHSALELHHAIFVDEFQPAQDPSHGSKVITHDLRQARLDLES